jgi:hypothetical protein
MRIGPIETAEDLHETGMLFCDAKVVLTAVELRLFTTLSAGPLSVEQVCKQCGLHPRGLRDFFEVLVKLGLLERDGDLYRNSGVAERFLDTGSQTYAGGFLERANRLMYPLWDKLPDLIRTGQQQAPGRDDQAATFARMAENPEHLRNFLTMLDALTDSLAPALAEAIAWDRYSTVIDVGGARGNVLARVLAAHPALSGSVFDQAPIEPFFREHMEKFGLLDRARFLVGNFFTDPLPAADVLIIGHVLHDWSLERRAMLIKKAHAAVAEHGCLLIYDPLTGGGQPSTWNDIVSLNMQLLSPGGSEYTAEECETWLLDAGFESVTTSPLGLHDTLVIARKHAGAE